jgi:hypothetical protein
MTDSANNGTQSDFAKAFRAVTPAHMREHRMRYIDDFNAFKILQAHTPHVACSTANTPKSWQGYPCQNDIPLEMS